MTTILQILRRPRPLLLPRLLLLLLPLLYSPLAAREAPKRVISLAPHITEIIYKIGAGDLLVGRTEFCLYPEQAQAVETVGGYLNPDFEKMVALAPDVVFLFPNTDLDRKLQMFGMKTFTVPNETIDEILQGIAAVGRVLHRDEAAERLATGILDTLSRLQQQSSRDDTLTSTLLLVGRESGSLRGLYAAGQETYLSELLMMCGGRNIFADVNARYFDVSKEDLVQRDPELIIEFRIMEDAGSAQIAALKQDWQALPLLRAVQSGRVEILTERYFLIPGPRISRIAMALHHLLNRSAE